MIAMPPAVDQPRDSIQRVEFQPITNLQPLLTQKTIYDLSAPLVTITGE